MRFYLFFGVTRILVVHFTQWPNFRQLYLLLVFPCGPTREYPFKVVSPLSKKDRRNCSIRTTVLCFPVLSFTFSCPIRINIYIRILGIYTLIGQLGPVLLTGPGPRLRPFLLTPPSVVPDLLPEGHVFPFLLHVFTGILGWFILLHRTDVGDDGEDFTTPVRVGQTEVPQDRWSYRVLNDYVLG